MVVMHIELGKIENGEWYVNKAFKRGKTRVNDTKIRDKSLVRAEKYKFLEHIRLSVVKDALINDLNRFLEKFPKYNELESFYKQLFGCFIDVDKYKKSLGAVKWARTKINDIFRVQNKSLANKKTVEDIMSVRNVFLARLSSIMKQIDKELKYLDLSRMQIKEMPNVKTSLPTIAIAGFPNVGKSTLLGKLTGSKTEVKAYAFTTKGLMIGYVKDGDDKIQVIDTPGTLNRFEKMNKIEKMADLTLKHLAELIVYVFDFTEPYDLGEQLKLYQDLKKMDKKILVYFSKSDIIDTKLIDGFEVKGVYKVDDLKKLILENVEKSD